MTQKQEKLVTENIGFAYVITRKYLNTGIEFEELFSIAKLGLVKAAIKYDESIGTKFITLAGTVIENELRMELRARNKLIKPISIEELLSEDSNYNSDDRLFDYFKDMKDPYMNIVNIDLLKDGLSILTDIEREMIYFYYFENKSQHEIEKIYHMSQSYISRVLKKALKKMKDYLERD